MSVQIRPFSPLTPISAQESFCIRIPVFDQKTALSVKDFLRQRNENDFFSDPVNNRWGLKKKKKEHFSVSFDKDCNVVEEYITAPFAHYKDYRTLQKAARIAMKQMAEAMGWAHQTHEMALSIMQHQLLPHEEAAGIEFHRDDSLHTLVVLLEDPQHPTTGWEGGTFLFKPQAAKEIVHTFQPQQGYGVLFSNTGSQHAITSFKPRSNRERFIERTILTLHDYGQTSKPLATYSWGQLASLKWTFTKPYQLFLFAIKQITCIFNTFLVS